MAEPSGQKAIVYLGSAVFFGLIAAGLSYLFLKSRAAAIEAELRGERDQMVDVVLAKQNLPKGLKITDAYFEIGQVPGKYVHPNTIRPTNFFDYSGRFLATDMQAGKTLLDSFLVEDFPVDFSDLVAQGRRAITITVDDVTTFSGLLRPGNRIDLYVNIPTNLTGFTPGGGAAIPVSMPGPAAEGGAEGAGASVSVATAPRDVILPVLQDVRVLATGREAYDETLDKLSYPQQRRSDNFTAVTLDVTPEQAALVSMAGDKGDLIAVLRNRNDRSAAEFTGVTPLDLVRNARRMQQLEAMRKAAAAIGATVDANGNLVTADGKVIPADQIVVGKDGALRTKDGKLLAPSDAMRKAAEAAGATIDANGNWVTKDGKVIPADQIVVGADGSIRTKDGKLIAPSDAMRKAAAAAGATIDENGNWVTKDGKVIPADQIVIGADGSIRTKDGKLVAPSEALRKAAAAAGATIDENGNWVTADGKVIPSDQLVIGPNGTVTTKDGKVLAAKGIRVNEKGEYVDADGNVIPPGDLVVNPDGTVTTKDEIMKAAGYTKNANGDYVDADGNVIKKEDVQVLANGTVMTKDGKVLAGPAVTKTKDGFLVAADGTVMTADGKILTGVTVNENGEVVTSTGEVLTDPNLTVAADGTVRDSSGNVIAGVSGSSLPPEFVQAAAAGAAAAPLTEAGLPDDAEAVRRLFIALTIGGSSKDGVPTTTLMPVQPVGQANPAGEAP